MIHVATALLYLPDGKIVFQRRSKDAKASPGLLGFFGGHVEYGESYDEAVRRELSEETSLNVLQLQLKHVADFEIDPSILRQTNRKNVYFHLYEGQIPNLQFEVFEGDHAEAHTIKEALKREDLSPSTRHVLTNILGEK